MPELLTPDDIEATGEHAGMLQAGTRNMQNTASLCRAGQPRSPVLPNRSPNNERDGVAAAAENLLAGGKDQVALCELGIRLLSYL
jgi:3-deoxy-D-arabino-heptulosonate 7-phosphate (DAHP) synthase